MVLINGRKHACAPCIRGHRASSCAHTGRQLQPVRSKGRPSSQCDRCKEKRAKGGFHGKCNCGRSSSMESSSQQSDLSTPVTAEGSSYWPNDQQGKHNLEELMNPCQCKITGRCTCCKSSSAQASEVSMLQDQLCDASCCSAESFCSAEVISSECVKEGSSSCCGGVTKRNRMRKSLPAITESATDAHEASKRSDCQCGPTCNCPQCSQNTDGATSDLDDCPGLCLNCSACLSGLTRPSGIKAVDDWMERDSSSNAVHQNERSALTALASEASKRPRSSRLKHAPLPNPPLPPFPQAAKFFSSHFLDEERRKYFSEQMQHIGDKGVESMAYDAPEELMYGQRLEGETDEDWQIRHGYYHLTPSAVKIFDAAREFKETRAAQEEKDERMQLERYSASTGTTTPVWEAGKTRELDELRQRALSARKGATTVKT